MNTVYLPGPIRQRLEQWAATDYPHEACGVLVGAQRDDEVQIQRVVQVRNMNTDRARDRFELNGEDLLRVDAEAEAEGLDIVGIWHTHPDHPALPSETDRAWAWQGWSYVILAVDRGRVVDLCCWRLVDGQFQEETVHSWQS